VLLKVASLQDAVFHTSSDHGEDHRTDCFEASPDILTGMWLTYNPHKYLNGIIKKQNKYGEHNSDLRRCCTSSSETYGLVCFSDVGIVVTSFREEYVNSEKSFEALLKENCFIYLFFFFLKKSVMIAVAFCFQHGAHSFVARLLKYKLRKIHKIDSRFVQSLSLSYVCMYVCMCIMCVYVLCMYYV
jgi:hypothetical protein